MESQEDTSITYRRLYTNKNVSWDNENFRIDEITYKNSIKEIDDLIYFSEHKQECGDYHWNLPYQDYIKEYNGDKNISFEEYPLEYAYRFINLLKREKDIEEKYEKEKRYRTIIDCIQKRQFDNLNWDFLQKEELLEAEVIDVIKIQLGEVDSLKRTQGIVQEAISTLKESRETLVSKADVIMKEELISSKNCPLCGASYSDREQLNEKIKEETNVLNKISDETTTRIQNIKKKIYEEYLEKVLASLNRRKICNGHAIGLGVDDLNIYAAGHLSDDHESVYYEELLERLRLGIMPLIREGSSERNVDTLVPGIVKNNLPTDNMMFCTDDKHVNDIFKEGHISYNVKRSIELGLDPVQAIQMATINAAKHFRLEDKIGSVAPGRFADILLIDDLTTMKPKIVLKSGRIVADENGARPVPEKAYPEKLFDTVHIGADFSAEKFIIHSEGKRAKCRVIDLVKDQIINKEIFEWMDVKEGQIAADVDRDILKLAVVERYGKNGRVSTALVHGFGLKQGALAASVSHDHHNIVVVGTNDRDMAVCVEKLQELHGGFVSAVEGQVVDALALPLGGLMSTLPAKTVMKRMDEMNGAVEKMGCPMKAPFMSLSFISLPTVPELGLTDFGLIDVLGHQIIDMIVETEA